MSTKDEAFQLAAEEFLEAACVLLDREIPPPPHWSATEYRNGELSVYRVQRGGGIDPQKVGRWAIGAGPTPRDADVFDTADEAMLRATVLAQNESESRA